MPARIPDMTVCIAAICESGAAIVLAADRFRWHPTASIETELDDPKFDFLTDQLALMSSGSTSVTDAVLRHFKRMPADSGLTVIEASERFVEACQAVRTKLVEDAYAKKLLGLKVADIRPLVAVANPGSIALDLYNRMVGHDFGTMFIVAGIDLEGAHVRTVDENASVMHSDFGYAAIGSGGTLATVSLVRRLHKKSATLPEALYNVYEAKKAAETARGVGSTTDISVIRKDKTRIDLDGRALDALEAAYKRLAPPSLSQSDIDAISNSLPS